MPYPSAVLAAAREYEKRFLFHGTPEPFTTKLRVGGDGILWTADSSAVAQAYIPEAGSSAYWSVSSFRLNDSPSPPGQYNTVEQALMELAGIRFDHVTYDATGRPTGWRVLTPGTTYRMIVDALVQLGYAPNRSGVYEIKLDGDRIVPADWKLVGRLFIITPKKPLKLGDITTGDPADLLDPEYLHYSRFEAFERAGFDGVKVPDLLQSKVWGNFGHDSVALFRRALRKISVRSIPATNYDPPDIAGWRVPTPEFIAFFLAQQC